MFCPKGAQDCNGLHWMTGFVTEFETVQVAGGRNGGGNVGRMVGKGAAVIRLSNPVSCGRFVGDYGQYPKLP